jgi:hypothetical protein
VITIPAFSMGLSSFFCPGTGMASPVNTTDVNQKSCHGRTSGAFLMAYTGPFGGARGRGYTERCTGHACVRAALF